MKDSWEIGPLPARPLRAPGGRSRSVTWCLLPARLSAGAEEARRDPNRVFSRTLRRGDVAPTLERMHFWSEGPWCPWGPHGCWRPHGHHVVVRRGCESLVGPFPAPGPERRDPSEAWGHPPWAGRGRQGLRRGFVGRVGQGAPSFSPGLLGTRSLHSEPRG